MNSTDMTKIVDGFAALFDLLPDELVLRIVKESLPNVVDSDEIPDSEVYELIKHYRNRDMPALKNFLRRVSDDAKREVVDT